MAKLRNITGSMIVAAIVTTAAATPASALVSPVGKASADETTLVVHQSAADDGWEGAASSALKSKYGASRGQNIDCRSNGYCFWTVYKTSKQSTSNVFHYGVASITRTYIYDKKGRKVGVTYKVTLSELK